jgi:selenide,water dikinase
MSRLVLVGGGHSHVEVIRRLAITPLADAQVDLVSPDRYAIYSGMLPGWVAGHYSRSQCSIDLPALCRAAGVRFRQTAATGLDPVGRHVQCSDGAMLEYDLASLNIGSTPDWDAIPGAFEHGVPVKPLTRFTTAWEALRLDARRKTTHLTIAVIGAGAGGVELAFAVQYALGGQHSSAMRPRLHLLTDKESILSDHGPGVARKLGPILRERGVAVHTHSQVMRIDAGTLRCGPGEPLSFDYALLATTAAAPKWLSGTGLKTDPRGFVQVDATLQSMSHQEVFAAGDAASIDGMPLPKSGVYAVRQGPVLADNLRRALAAKRLIRYEPQKSALALISTGDRYAVASWRGLVLSGAWVWRWKDHIDRRFIAKYHA